MAGFDHINYDGLVNLVNDKINERMACAKMVLSIKHLQKYYGRQGALTKALNNISFEVKEAEFIAIMGPSGSGKTTLLNCVGTIDRPTSGHIFFNGCDITSMTSKALSDFRKEHLGFIFQDYNLIETMTGFENISLSLNIQALPRNEIIARIRNTAQILQIEDVLEKYPFQMSGGQQQRVAVARAMVTSPSLILADEPTGALDSRASRLLLESFQIFNETLKSTILIVTHDVVTASYCKRVLFMKDGKIFNEIIRGDDSRKEFFDHIMEVMALWGGNDHVF